MTSKRIEAHGEAIIDFKVPTCSYVDPDSGKIVEDCLPPGEYQVVCYVDGYRVYGLERTFEITVRGR